MDTRRKWLRVTHDNGLRVDVILAVDRLTPVQSRSGGGRGRLGLLPDTCTNLTEEDRQTKEES